MKLKAAVERDCGYGSTKNIAIAVASDDPGVTLDDGSYVNMAQEVMDDLAAKTTIHWIVTDSVQKAIDGVYAGDTYAAVILSEDFTARMTDLSTAVSSGGAGMTYYENGKKNAVASKITQTAVTSLQQDVRAKYLGNLFSQLYSDTTELTGSANIAQAAGQVSQHIAALGAKLRTYSNVIGNILGDSVALDQLTQGGGLTFEGADTWQQQIENSTALLSQVQEQSGQAASALTGSLEDLESALQQAAKGDQAALTDAAQAAKDAQTKVQNIRSVLAHLSRLDGVSQTLTLLDTAELHLQQIRTVIEDKAVTNEQIQTCLEAMPSLEKLAAGEIRADLEQIAGGVKNAATDVQPLLKAMETMKQDIVPAIDAADVFFTPEHREQIEKTAAECGYSVDFYPDGHLPPERAAEYEIVYGCCLPGELKAAANLKWFCCSFAGVDIYMDESIYPHPGVLLSNSSGAYGITIAEHIIMVTLMLLRRMPEFEKVVRERGWLRTLPMRSICGSSITILGTGDIGTNFAVRAKALGAKAVRGVRRTQKAGDPAYDAMYTFAELDSVLPKTEILVMALPGTPETHHILSRERIALLPEGAYVVNVGRGSAIDQEALMEALNGGHLAGAALDVMVPEPLPKDHPLWDTKNLLLTPHISGNMSLGITCDRDVALFCEDLKNFASGKKLKRFVDRSLGY